MFLFIYKIEEKYEYNRMVNVLDNKINKRRKMSWRIIPISIFRVFYVDIMAKLREVLTHKLSQFRGTIQSISKLIHICIMHCFFPVQYSIYIWRHWRNTKNWVQHYSQIGSLYLIEYLRGHKIEPVWRA